jgi:hypothetical protein
MTVLRFDFQRMYAREAEGPILNLGCNEDPANLKALYGAVNADIRDYDPELGVKLPVDIIMDATDVADWNVFDDKQFDLIVIGDMLEHILAPDIDKILRYARRVARKIVITVPNDHRLGPGWHENGERDPEREDPDWYIKTPGLYHATQVTEELLRSKLEAAGWTVQDWRTVPYGFCPEGYFVLAT